MLYISEKTPHVGQEIIIDRCELLSLLFVDRYDITRDLSSRGNMKQVERTEEACDCEVDYMLNYLQNEELIELKSYENDKKIILTPRAYRRIEEIQKNTSNGRNVLVAMKFGKETTALREAIRKGIRDAGYNAIFIDEVQHNDFITPELLKYIRDSRFIVVDLTHKNNGAYFEEGYAMGLGKAVIQLCKEGTDLHFDVAQKNTIMWIDEDAIPLKLTNRIKATID